MEFYFDHATASKPSERALSEMMPYFTEMWGSPISPHSKGQQLFTGMEKAYRSIYQLLGADDKDTFVFTSSGAEAINHLLFAIHEDIAMETGKNHFVTSNAECAPAIMSIERLEKFGCVGKVVKVQKGGLFSAEDLGDVISPRTALVSVSWANGLTGVIQPLDEISDLCKERGILLHIDATHCLGKMYFELEDLGADFITFNGSQLQAPQGTGGLLIRGEQRLSPFIVGGLDQGGNRAGTLNVPAFMGLSVAAEEAVEARDYMCTETARLKNQLEVGIQSAFPEAQVLFQDFERLPHITAMAFPGVANEALMYSLNRKKVFANIGGGEYQQLSYLLKTAGIDAEIANTAISFALSRETNDLEIQQAIEIIGNEANKLRKVSQLCL